MLRTCGVISTTPTYEFEYIYAVQYISSSSSSLLFLDIEYIAYIYDIWYMKTSLFLQSKQAKELCWVKDSDQCCSGFYFIEARSINFTTPLKWC